MSSLNLVCKVSWSIYGCPPNLSEFDEHKSKGIMVNASKGIVVISEILRVTFHLNTKESWPFLCLLVVEGIIRIRRRVSRKILKITRKSRAGVVRFPY